MTHTAGRNERRWPFPAPLGPTMLPEHEPGAAVRLAVYALRLRGHSAAYFLDRAVESPDRQTLAALAYHARTLSESARREHSSLDTIDPRRQAS